MKLVLLGRGRWTVYAACSGESTCPVLDLIEQLDRKRGSKLLSDLCVFVPWSEPRDWIGIDFSWKLRGTDSILEFRWPTKAGGTPRVFWFYDAGNIIVCSHGVNKKGDADPQDIETAEDAYHKYLASKKAGTLVIVPLKDFAPVDKDGE